jgi:hypothetical protein
MVARSVFERLEASGFRELTVHLTEEARAHGLAATVPARFTASVGYGRGKRTKAHENDLVGTVRFAQRRVDRPEEGVA